VIHNEESRKLQYAMQQRLRMLGWQEIEVIDEDLGRSAAGTVTRSGFERMVADVCLGKVGAVAAREVSRFARNSREWQQLVEVCRVVDTLLVDQETVYAPRQSNDRLLLGLKGSLNEYELDLLRQRSVEARQEKARRGELPVRPIGGELAWKRPKYAVLYRILTNPVYGGAYAYGKTEHAPRYENGQPRRTARRKPKEQWLALIPHHYEGYIDWETFGQIQAMISANNLAGSRTGAPRRGLALLAGILHCRRCGRRMLVHYTGRDHDVLRYACHRGHLDSGEPKCIGFGGIPVDAAIADQVLRVIAPQAVEAAVLASQQEADRQDDVLKALERDLQAARYQAARAEKQYDAADPENRLVADELESRWNQALKRVVDLQTRIEKHHGSGCENSPASLDEFENLAADLDAVWNNPETDVRLKKRIVRTLIQDVIADVDSEAGEIILTIHWKGGIHTELRVPRRRRGQATHTSKEIVGAVRVLARICSDDLIAGVLNRNGLRTGRSNRWTRQRVTSLRSYHKIPRYCPHKRRQQGWLNLTQSAKLLGISPRTLRLAVERGEIRGEHPLSDGPWVFNRCDLETEAARTVVLRAKSRNGNPAVPNPAQQTLPFSST